MRNSFPFPPPLFSDGLDLIALPYSHLLEVSAPPAKFTLLPQSDFRNSLWYLGAATGRPFFFPSVRMAKNRVGLYRGVNSHAAVPERVI